MKPLDGDALQSLASECVDAETLRQLASEYGIDPLMLALLHRLLQTSDGEWVSLPRLVKSLASSGSDILRVLSALSQIPAQDAAAQKGWVEVRSEGLRWTTRLTEEGRSQAQGLFQTKSPAKER